MPRKLERYLQRCVTDCNGSCSSSGVAGRRCAERPTRCRCAPRRTRRSTRMPQLGQRSRWAARRAVCHSGSNPRLVADPTRLASPACAGSLQMFVGPTCAAQCYNNTLTASCADCAAQQAYCVVQNCLRNCLADSSAPACVSCSDIACGEAFQNCSGLERVGVPLTAPSSPPSPPRPSPPPPAPPSSPTPPCNEADAKLYADSSAWNALLTSCGNTCGFAMFDGPDCAAQCLRENSLSADCANCTGRHAVCTATSCLLECAADPTAPGCLACADAKCLDAFQSCSGLGAPPRSSLPPSPPSDVPDPHIINASDHTLACNEADADIYTNATVWLDFHMVCGLQCGPPQLLNPDSTCFADCPSVRGNLSRRCAVCAGKNTHCSAKNCLTESKLTRTSRGLCAVCAGLALPATYALNVAEAQGSLPPGRHAYVCRTRTTASGVPYV